MKGCATTLRLDPVAIEGQQELYQEGTKTLIWPKNSLVAIRPSTNTYQSAQRPTLVVSVLNGTEKPFNFSTEDIDVYVDNKPIKVSTYDELVAEVKRQRAFAAFAIALSSVAQSMNAANAIRSLLNAASGKAGKKYMLEIVEWCGGTELIMTIKLCL